MAKKSNLTLEKMPSRPTLFRIRIVDAQSYALVRQGISRLKPVLWLRDARKVSRITQAQTPEDVLDLAPLATGLGELAWHEQMRKFGQEVLPFIAAAIRQVMRVKDETLRDRSLAHMIAELRWREEAGAGVLLEHFSELDESGKSLACVALGLLGTQAATDTIWEYYLEVIPDREAGNFIGALWGLVDLQDARAAGALAGLLADGYFFYELFGLLARAGDARAVIPLLELAPGLQEEDRMDPMLALVGIAHRIGREALVAEIERRAMGEESRKEYESLADLVLSKPASLSREYFSVFYRGFDPGDVAGAFDRLAP